MRRFSLRLFREATQLKTVGMSVRVAGIEILRVEPQEHAVSPAKSGRPTVPAAADARQNTRIPIAEARGGVCLRLFREATQLKTVTAMMRVAGVEILRGKAQDHPVSFTHGGRPAVPVAAEAPQRALAVAAVARGGVCLRLFREATQLKTVGAVCRIARSQLDHAEIKISSINFTDRRRPAIAVASDIAQHARGTMAEARGGAFFSRAPLGNLVKTCQHILTISPLRRGARVELCPG